MGSLLGEIFIFNVILNLGNLLNSYQEKLSCVQGYTIEDFGSRPSLLHQQLSGSA